MDILVWFMDKEGNKTIASAVTKNGAVALSALLFVKSPVYVIQVNKTPKEFIEGLPEGIVACLYTEGLLQELEPENKLVN